jgi:putative FmdB family regulatory protein
MPTYGYRCKDCGSEFERFQKMTDAPVTTCDSCGGSVKRLLYPVGIQFKGSGFHVNDYVRSGGGASKDSGTEAKEAKGESKAESAPAPAPSSPAESKPAASS